MRIRGVLTTADCSMEPKRIHGIGAKWRTSPNNKATTSSVGCSTLGQSWCRKLCFKSSRHIVCSPGVLQSASEAVHLCPIIYKCGKCSWHYQLDLTTYFIIDITKFCSLGGRDRLYLRAVISCYKLSWILMKFSAPRSPEEYARRVWRLWER